MTAKIEPWMLDAGRQVNEWTQKMPTGWEPTALEIAAIIGAHAPKQELNMNVIKSLIVDRLYDREGICSCCGKKGKGHGNYHLPSRLPLESVLKAINLDEYYFVDD